MSSFSQTLSRILGFIVIFVTLILRIPQILQIYQNKSGEGISILSLILDILSDVIYMAYSYLKEFPFSQWGEIIFLVLQTVVMGMLILHYESTDAEAAAFGLFSSVLVWIFMQGYIPVDVLWSIQSLNILILLMSKLIQIYTNYENSNTGQLSPISANLLFATTLVRVFTSVEETGDLITILGNAVAAVTNGILVAQIRYYSGGTKNN